MKDWFVYIIEDNNGALYTGITTDVTRRWHEHSSLKSGAKYFRGKKPKALKYVEICPSRSEASKRESFIKKLNRAQKLQLISTSRILPQINLCNE